MAEPSRPSELRATLIVAGLIFGILGVGLLGDALVGRHRVTIGPGVTIVPPSGAESSIGPRDLVSKTWRLEGSRLDCIPLFDGLSTREQLDRHVEEEIVGRFGGVLDGPPEPSEHPAGEALVQRWRAPAGGDEVDGEVVAVTLSTTTVLFDLRWPRNEQPGVLAELRRTVASLRIQPLR